MESVKKYSVQTWAKSLKKCYMTTCGVFMKKADYPEIGYTPANFRALVKASGLTMKEIAEITESSDRSPYRWAKDVGTPNHWPMSYGKWITLVEAVESMRRTA